MNHNPELILPVNLNIGSENIIDDKLVEIPVLLSLMTVLTKGLWQWLLRLHNRNRRSLERHGLSSGS